MSKEQESLKRSKKRSEKRKKSKMDKILNSLIAIVSILIILNVFAIFTDNKKQPKQSTETAIQNESNEGKEDTNEEQPFENHNMVSAEEVDENGKQELADASDESSSELITKSSNDPLVEEVIIDPEWKVNPTKQTGEHVSAYEEGHIDYEEKLVTIRNAVQLKENNIIYWSVRNNGGPNSAVAVVSTNDKNDYYRVYIEWVEQKGWKPVKVEKLNQAIGVR
ncbi:YrrS family protein [Lysinibacillus yapensis]|nr:YrrS family protein [Lysinibacillus yapensis]